MDVSLKSNFRKICAYANNFGFVLDVLSKFMVIFASLTISHHKQIGKLLSTDANPATKLFLNVHIARSAAFLLCLCVGAYCTTVFSFCNILFNAVDA